MTHTLDEVVECPQVVKHMLNDECNLGQTYMGARCAAVSVPLPQSVFMAAADLPDCTVRSSLQPMSATCFRPHLVRTRGASDSTQGHTLCGDAPR